MADFRRLLKQLLSAVADANTAAIIERQTVANVREFTVYVVFSAGCSAGAVVVEAAHSEDYTGTWSNLGTVNWAAASRAHPVSVTGCHIAIRVRISTAIVGGTIDAWAVAN